MCTYRLCLPINSMINTDNIFSACKCHEQARGHYSTSSNAWLHVQKLSRAIICARLMTLPG